MSKTYLSEEIRKTIDAERERLFSSYAVGRPTNWSVDQQTRDIICISVWLREEMTLIGLDELGRKTQEGVFNRYSRSTEDLFGLAAEIMNDVVVNNIDRDRKTHRRWG